MLLYSESCSGVFSSTVCGGGGRDWAQLVKGYLIRINHVQSWPCKMSFTFSQGSFQRGRTQ